MFFVLCCTTRSERSFGIVTRFTHVQPIGIIVASAIINHRLYKLSKLDAVYYELIDVSEPHCLPFGGSV